MTGFAIGVDLGGTNLRIAAVDEQGTLLEKVTTNTQVARGRDVVITEMCDAIRALAGKFSRTQTLLGAGIGVPGIIDQRRGMLRQSPNLPGWHDYPVREEIERRLESRVVLENDANSAALGESWLGAARGVDSVVMLTLGTGVGGGIVQHGRIWQGMTGMAGELGHVTVDPEGPACGCGSRGCAEQYGSATAVVRMAREAIASGMAPELAQALGSAPEFSAERLYELAVGGNAEARAIFARVGWALGILLGSLINVFNCPMYVIGGGVSAAWPLFSPAMLEEVRRRSFVYAATTPADGGGSAPTVITRARLGSDAGLFGAARLPMLEAEASQQRARL